MALKQRILQLLENSRGQALSGQQIADQLSVSRASVWKGVKALQLEGYKIVATTNKGYVLLSSNDILSEQSLRACLDPKYADIEVVALKTSPSTNAEAMTRLMSGQLRHGALIVADEQTNGRGRMGKTFFSPKKGIYMSVSLCKSIENMQDVMVITPATAVAVRRSIAKLTGIDAKIKWVNDLYIGKKKVCGILTQADIDFESGKAGTFIVGIGINFVEQDFPDDIKDKACALFTGEPTITRSQLIAEIYDNLISLTSDLTDRTFMQEYKEHSMVIGKEISYVINCEDKRGKVIDIDNDGGLVIQEGDTIRKLTCGEISIRSTENEWI
ncbi:MAG: biotin--[acetyl-CoA-carboxylase] ligase [Clostridia bacterium]|nr:biotin--[acetyl-CoA-carboxylase] ligase [Clostridia bacterium]